MKKLPSRKATRLFALAFAVLFSLSTVRGAAAVGVSNGEFFFKWGCSLMGWQTTGTVALVDAGAEGLPFGDECAAKVTAANGNYYGVTTSTLRQTVTVPALNASEYYLLFDSWVRSSDPGSIWQQQTVNLYDAQNNLIYTKTKNSNSVIMLGVFKYNVAPYANQQLTLEVKVTNSAPNGSASVYLDDVAIGIDGRDGRMGWGW
ncbi:MAG TPA: hypothetical protein VGE07_03855 [Herpetosiphonaceae bacterium]